MLRKGEEGEEVSFSPLTALTSFMESEPDMVRVLKVDSDVIPWIAPTDKLAQLEFYYSKQSTAIGSRCKHCMEREGKELLLESDQQGGGLRITPLSKQEEGERKIVWWCSDCCRIRDICTEVQPSEHPILEQLSARQFKPGHVLSGVLDRDSFRYYLDQLPSMKAAGSDAIPYELLRDAPEPLLKELFDTITGC